MATTIPVAVPEVTEVPVRTRLSASTGSVVSRWPRSRVRVSALATGRDSPDSAAWLTVRSLAVRIRRSAGIRSPAASLTTSPGTTCSMGTSKVVGAEPLPARRCTAHVVVTSLFSASAARPERNSCQKRSSPLTPTITLRMTTPGSAGSCAYMTAARKTRTAMKGFA